MYLKTGLRAGFAQRLRESLPVPVILENLLTVIAMGHHVIHRARLQGFHRRQLPLVGPRERWVGDVDRIKEAFGPDCRFQRL